MIGHRGASGHRPEHTSLAYRLAWRSGADSVEPDVVSTRDGVLVCRHDLDLARTTDVAQHPELAGRRRRFRVDGKDVDGWFVGDLDLAEIRQLRVRERWPRMRPGSARYDGQLGVLTLEELLDLRAEESARAGRTARRAHRAEASRGLRGPGHAPARAAGRPAARTPADLTPRACRGDVLRRRGAQAAAAHARRGAGAAGGPRPLGPTRLAAAHRRLRQRRRPAQAARAARRPRGPAGDPGQGGREGAGRRSRPARLDPAQREPVPARRAAPTGPSAHARPGRAGGLAAARPRRRRAAHRLPRGRRRRCSGRGPWPSPRASRPRCRRPGSAAGPGSG